MRALLYLLFPLSLLSSDLDLLYDDSEVAVIDITMDPAALTWMYEHINSDSMHVATVHFSNAHIDEEIENVGIRLRGNTSRESAKKSFKLSFNTFEPGRKFYDVEKLNLNGEHNDPSIMRSKIAWDHYQKTGMPTTKAAHCAVYINDVYYGLYISIEHIDEEFLKNHFEDDTGNLWKCLWPADLTYRGPDPDNYHPYQDETRPYELKTNVDAYDYSELARLITILHETPNHLLPDSLEQVLVVTDVLKYAAMNVLLGNWDDYWFLRNNYYLYHEPTLDRIRFIPYDYDNNLGIDWFNIDWTSVNPYDFPTLESPGDRPLMERIMANTQYRNLYTHILEYFRDNITELGLFEARLDYLKSLITPWAEQDTFRTLDYAFTLSDFHQSYTSDAYSNQHVKKGLKQFINARHSAMNTQLDYEPAPPVIYDLKYSPQIPGPNDSIYVEVSAFSNAGLDSLTIAYHPGVLTVVISYPMRFSPTDDPQSIEESDRWIGVIPPMGEMGHGRFQVGAMDMNGQSMLYPRSDFVFLQVPGTPDNPLLINEFLADNDQFNPDEAGEYDDWLEIYNSGPEDVHLSGKYLTDDPLNLTKWMFPFGGVALESGGHLLVWCDEDQEQPGIHTNFKLSRGGEFIALVDIDGVTILDAINFGPQQSDVSYGRLPDGGLDWVTFDSPTPGASNVTSTIDAVGQLPDEIHLTNYPNPFNAETIIKFELPQKISIELSIIDFQGREMTTLAQGVHRSGRHSVTWNAQNGSGRTVPSGIYFARLKQGNLVNTHKILLIK